MAANPYDPVLTTDSTRLTDDDWGLSLPPIKYTRFSGTSRFKSLCDVLRRHNRTIMIVFTAVFVVFLIVMIIAVASNNDSGRHPTGQEDKWVDPEQGLVFYPKPEDNTIVVSFTPVNFDSMTPLPIKKSLNNVLKNYDSVKQLNEDSFVDCNITYAPGNKTCRVSSNLFGNECTNGMNFGYHGAQPCIFIQLNLPDGVTIKPIQNTSLLWEDAKTVMGDKPDPSHVPVTCRGTTSLDIDILEKTTGYGPKGERIMYYPPGGLLSYIYRERDTTLPFLKPAVMVQFTSLATKHMVHVTCTAWGQLYDSRGMMFEHKLLSVQFALYANQD